MHKPIYTLQKPIYDFHAAKLQIIPHSATIFEKNFSQKKTVGTRAARPYNPQGNISPKNIIKSKCHYLTSRTNRTENFSQNRLSEQEIFVTLRLI